MDEQINEAITVGVIPKEQLPKPSPQQIEETGEESHSHFHEPDWAETGQVRILPALRLRMQRYFFKHCCKQRMMRYRRVIEYVCKECKERLWIWEKRVAYCAKCNHVKIMGKAKNR